MEFVIQVLKKEKDYLLTRLAYAEAIEYTEEVKKLQSQIVDIKRAIQILKAGNKQVT